MKKKIGAFGARQFFLETLVGGRPGTTIFQNPGGGGGGWGGSHTRTGPGRPPVQETRNGDHRCTFVWAVKTLHGANLNNEQKKTINSPIIQIK